MQSKSKKGFTLIELLVVMTISAVLIASLGSGIVNLQSMVKLDNTIRDIKLEIQSTQNQARNSFITYDRTNLNNVTGSFFQGGTSANNISLGWMITFENPTSDSVLIKRRSVFFKPSTSYNFDRLRDEIVNFRNTLINVNPSKKFECDSSGNFKVGGVNQNNNYTSITGSSISINCAYKGLSYSGSEYFETTIPTVIFSKDFGTNALPSCWQTGNSGVQQSIFFTSGYGEPVVNVEPTVGQSDCQLQIKYIGLLNNDYRALKVSKDTGIVELCGVYCVN